MYQYLVDVGTIIITNDNILINSCFDMTDMMTLSLKNRAAPF